MHSQIQTQNEPSDMPINVGIENLRTQIKIKNEIHMPVMSIKISTLNRRGVHMSRIVEAITESLEIDSDNNLNSLEDYAVAVFNALKKRHIFDYFDFNLATQLAVTTITPVSKLHTWEVHDVFLNLKYENGELKKTLIVKVIGGSACPHALANSPEHRTHLQRSEITLSFASNDMSDYPRYEDLIAICNASFSSPVYTLLKTIDEQHVVNSLFNNPCFVEDIIRNAIINSQHLKNGILDIIVRNFESIHRHDVIAQKRIIKA